MRTVSVDLRERILDAYDQAEGNREEIAHRYRVSLGLVKKLLQQRRRKTLDPQFAANDSTNGYSYQPDGNFGRQKMQSGKITGKP